MDSDDLDPEFAYEEYTAKVEFKMKMIVRAQISNIWHEIYPQYIDTILYYFLQVTSGLKAKGALEVC